MGGSGQVAVIRASLLLQGGRVMEILICFGLCPLSINEIATLIFSEMFQRRIH